MNAQTITGALVLCQEPVLLQSITCDVCLMRHACSCIREASTRLCMANPCPSQASLLQDPRGANLCRSLLLQLSVMGLNINHSACCKLLGICSEKRACLPRLGSGFCQKDIAVGRHLDCSFRSCCMASGHFGAAGLQAVWHLVNLSLGCTITASFSMMCSFQHLPCCHIWVSFDAQDSLVIICIQQSCSPDVQV